MPAQKSKSPFFRIPLIGSWLERFSSSQKELIENVLHCPDNDALPRIPEAGKIEGNAVVMHNGLKLSTRSFGSDLVVDLVKANKGVAEPQQEHAFAEVLRTMGPSPLILDIGARGGYYSLWMKQSRPGARCVVVEPNKKNLEHAKANFTLNKLNAQFFNAYVSMTSGRKVDNVDVMTVDGISQKLHADYINLLHADIEGYELELIKGAIPVLKDRGVDYMILSTHTETLHKQCKELLEAQRYITIADISPQMSYVDDGLIVARRAELKGLDFIPLSQKPVLETVDAK